MSDRAKMIELTNLCMVYDDNDNILRSEERRVGKEC